MASSSSCSSISRGRDVMGLGKGLCTAVGNTYATCNSELVLWVISAAVVRASLASLERTPARVKPRPQKEVIVVWGGGKKTPYFSHPGGVLANEATTVRPPLHIIGDSRLCIAVIVPTCWSNLPTSAALPVASHGTLHCVRRRADPFPSPPSGRSPKPPG